MKIIISIIFITFFSMNLSSEEIKKDEIKVKNEEQKTMTDDEFFKKFMELDNESKNLQKLNKSADEVIKTLGVDK